MDTKEKIKVMQAFVDGKTIVFTALRTERWREADSEELTWDWGNFEYKVKDEYRPFLYGIDDLKELLGKAILSKNDSCSSRIIGIVLDNNRVCVGSSRDDENWIPYKELLENWLFDDETPCGVLIGEDSNV
jgi:hypothetical protein